MDTCVPKKVQRPLTPCYNQNTIQSRSSESSERKQLSKVGKLASETLRAATLFPIQVSKQTMSNSIIDCSSGGIQLHYHFLCQVIVPQSQRWTLAPLQCRHHHLAGQGTTVSTDSLCPVSPQMFAPVWSAFTTSRRFMKLDLLLPLCPLLETRPSDGTGCQDF